ncbi:twin-arginine translocase subunit TatC [Blattabacterium cuenoti]|uniref:twin-arginine translocase subunit TatC n=1 Tax=Blattabacterium cuenoti TaxID=1653831 RepID=UPI00163D3970|nr:twin-arginine translocase subunit TatC [Blattabacterium cuenoti]
MCEEKQFPFWEHIEELRKHIIHCFFAIVITTIVLMNNKNIIFDSIIFGPAKKDFITYRLFSNFTRNFLGFNFKPILFLSKNLEIQNRKIFGQFNTYIFTCIIGGIILSFPYILYEFWRFVKPALSKKEKKYSKGIIGIISLLFISGVLFGYYILFPFLINFGYFFKISSLPKNIFDLSDYISLIIYSVFSMGIIFLFPFFIFFLSKIKIISYIFLKKNRKYAILIMLIIASAITPGDILSTIIVFVPLLILYEISIYISYYAIKK